MSKHLYIYALTIIFLTRIKLKDGSTTHLMAPLPSDPQSAEHTENGQADLKVIHFRIIRVDASKYHQAPYIAQDRNNRGTYA